MSVVGIISGVVFGVEAHPVTVSVEVAAGPPRWSLVGLPEGTAVLESRVRVRAAIVAAGFKLLLDKVTVDVTVTPRVDAAGASALDLPIALGVLAAFGQAPPPSGWAFDMLPVGELGLDGSVRPVRGVLPLAEMAWRRVEAGLDGGIMVSSACAREAAWVKGLRVLAVNDLAQAVNCLREPERYVYVPPPADPVVERRTAPDMADVKGLDAPKRALEIAAAGGHGVFLVGPPGSGKTMLTRRVAGILPPMTAAEALDCARVASVAGLLDPGSPLSDARPFRAPHHTVSAAGLVGGGPHLRPGEAPLAHNGVLFLDELSEFSCAALEALRQPLEDRAVTLVRSRASVRYPAGLMLVTATNPCPCGFYGSTRRDCTCSLVAVERYRERVFGGPLARHLDITVDMDPVPYKEQKSGPCGETSVAIRARVTKARQRQLERLAPFGMRVNAEMTPVLSRRLCALDSDCTALLRLAVDRLAIPASAVDKAIRVARTIADLAGEDNIGLGHVREALMLAGRFQAA